MKRKDKMKHEHNNFFCFRVSFDNESKPDGLRFEPKRAKEDEKLIPVQ